MWGGGNLRAHFSRGSGEAALKRKSLRPISSLSAGGLAFFEDQFGVGQWERGKVMKCLLNENTNAVKHGVGGEIKQG